MPIALQEEIQKQYEKALAALVEKIEQDRTVLAAILFGSLSYDEVWKNSDIDMWIIMEDGQKSGGHTLTESAINIHAQLIPRSDFKRRIEGDLTGGWLDFSFAKSALLFSKDDSVKQWYQNLDQVGTRDQVFQLMRNAASVIPSLNKAEKYFHLKEDYAYSIWWLAEQAEPNDREVVPVARAIVACSRGLLSPEAEQLHGVWSVLSQMAEGQRLRSDQTKWYTCQSHL